MDTITKQHFTNLLQTWDMTDERFYTVVAERLNTLGGDDWYIETEGSDAVWVRNAENGGASRRLTSRAEVVHWIVDCFGL
jgi:hypothetical protein